jgi:tetratricopeptide (TPR) repeat protein
VLFCVVEPATAQPPAEPQVQELVRAGLLLSAGNHYLEALDLFNEARDFLEQAGARRSRLYGDVLYASAAAKIKGRLRQAFPAAYVKSALKDIQACNRLREKTGEALPQECAESWFLEGYIQKRFFMRKEEAVTCFMRAVSYDRSFGPAKRELSELVVEPADSHNADKKE